MDHRRTTLPFPHPLFTPRQRHPRKPPPVGRDGPLSFQDDPMSSLRSNFADFGDYDTPDGEDEYEFELLPSISGTIAQRRAATGVEPIMEINKRQEYEALFEEAIGPNGLPIEEGAFGNINWTRTPVQQGAAAVRDGIDDVSPKSSLPAIGEERLCVEFQGLTVD